MKRTLIKDIKLGEVNKVSGFIENIRYNGDMRGYGDCILRRRPCAIFSLLLSVQLLFTGF